MFVSYVPSEITGPHFYNRNILGRFLSNECWIATAMVPRVLCMLFFKLLSSTFVYLLKIYQKKFRNNRIKKCGQEFCANITSTLRISKLARRLLYSFMYSPKYLQKFFPRAITKNRRFFFLFLNSILLTKECEFNYTNCIITVTNCYSIKFFYLI